MPDNARLLLLDLASVLDYTTIDPVAMLRKSADANLFKTFEKQARRDAKNTAREEKGPVQWALEKLQGAFSFHATPSPKLLPGAASLVDHIAAHGGYSNNVRLMAADSTPVTVEGKEYNHTYFNPHFAAFREATKSASSYICATFANIGLEGPAKSDTALDDYFKLSTHDTTAARDRVLIVTADPAKAEKATSLGYKTAVIRNNDYAAVLPEITSFTKAALSTAPRGPQTTP